MHDCGFILSNWDSVGRGHSSVNSLKSCQICPRTPACSPVSLIHFSVQSSAVYSYPNACSVCSFFTAVFCSAFRCPTLPSPQRLRCPIFASADFYSSGSGMKLHLNTLNADGPSVYQCKGTAGLDKLMVTAKIHCKLFLLVIRNGKQNQGYREAHALDAIGEILFYFRIFKRLKCVAFYLMKTLQKTLNC